LRQGGLLESDLMSEYVENLHQITKEITLKAMEKNHIEYTDGSNAETMAETYAQQIGNFYQKVYKSISECDK
jgi:hypothetical protein